MVTRAKRKPAAKSRRCVRISAEKFATLAAQLVRGHATLIEEGYQLAPKSNIRSRKDGSYGGTFVYAKPRQDSVALTISHNVSFRVTE